MNSTKKLQNKWYECKTWQSAYSKYPNELINDFTLGINPLNFNWSEIYNQIKIDPKSESVGVLRADSDFNLYIHQTIIPKTTSFNKYEQSIEVMTDQLEPGYFFFHTHFDNPLPSDLDLYNNLLLNRVNGRYIADVIVSPYGILVYCIKPTLMSKLSENYFNFIWYCHHLINVYNSFIEIGCLDIQHIISEMSNNFGYDIMPVYITSKYTEYVNSKPKKDYNTLQRYPFEEFNYTSDKIRTGILKIENSKNGKNKNNKQKNK